jgi:ABC-type dipeptide/oligopeptide/nickel transport system ATPase subunit
MKTVTQKEALMNKIILLENQQKEDLLALKAQFQDTYESLKPLNYIKSTLHEVTNSSDIGKELINGAINLTTGYLSNKVLMISNSNPMKNALGSALKFVMRKFFGKKTGETASVF